MIITYNWSWFQNMIVYKTIASLYYVSLAAYETSPYKMAKSHANFCLLLISNCLILSISGQLLVPFGGNSNSNTNRLLLQQRLLMLQLLQQQQQTVATQPGWLYYFLYKYRNI